MTEHGVQYPDYHFQQADKVLQHLPKKFVTKMERLPQGEIVDLVTEIGLFYDLPEKTYMHGIGIPAFSADRIIMRYIESREGLGWSQIPSSGLALETRGSQYVVIGEHSDLSKRDILTHELIHALRTTKINYTAEPNEHQIDMVTEAAVTILQAGVSNKDTRFLIEESDPKGPSVLRKILKEVIKIPYGDQAIAMLSLMQATRNGPHPITLKDLANRYFSEDKFFPLHLMEAFAERIPQEDIEAYSQHFEYLPS